MQVIIIILLVLVIIYITRPNDVRDSMYLNMNLHDMCKHADNGIDADMKREIEKLKKEYSNKLDACQKKYTDEKKRGDQLYLKYGDPEPNSVDFLYYGNDTNPILGDDKLAYRMHDMGQKNKHAMINRAMWNKNSAIPYFEEELNSHANSIWYDDDTLDDEF